MTFCLRKRLLIEKPKTEGLSFPLWVHCASVGEFNTFKPILRELRKNYSVVLTYFSPRAKDYLEAQGELYDLLFPLPLDIPPLIKKFESLIEPRALLVLEREFWPSLVKTTKTRKLLINSYAKGSFLERLLVQEFSLIVARTPESKEMFEREGAKRVVVCGNLKLVQEGEIKPLDLPIPEGFRLFVAGSTREGEEELLVEVFERVRRKVPLKLVIAPRHLSRVPEIERLLEGKDIPYRRRSSMGGDWDVLIVDTLGELRSFYSLADVTFVGGTFSPVGGHNLLEPAYLGKPVIFGPSTHKVRDLEEFLLKKGYGFRVCSVEELSAVLERLLLEGFEPEEDLRKYAEKVKECYMKAILSELE